MNPCSQRVNDSITLANSILSFLYTMLPLFATRSMACTGKFSILFSNRHVFSKLIYNNLHGTDDYHAFFRLKFIDYGIKRTHLQSGVPGLFQWKLILVLTWTATVKISSMSTNSCGNIQKHGVLFILPRQRSVAKIDHWGRGKPMISWPTNFLLNAFSGLSAKTGKLLNKLEACKRRESVERDKTQIRKGRSMMSWSTKFQLNPISGFSANVQ